MAIDKTLESAVVSAPSLNLTVEASLLTAFYELLQAGFMVRCKAGVSIENLFYEQFGLNRQLVEGKISTIFLNGKPVDDIGSTIVEDGATLALSGAMPGLVGATLRRKSPLASFRQSISAGKNTTDKKNSEGCVQIKLFNILLKELGPVFLEMGIFVRGVVCKLFLEKQTSEFWNKCMKILVDGKHIHAREFSESYLSMTDQDLVCLKVILEKLLKSQPVVGL
jgi:hypothetical protein